MRYHPTQSYMYLTPQLESTSEVMPRCRTRRISGFTKYLVTPATSHLTEKKHHIYREKKKRTQTCISIDSDRLASPQAKKLARKEQAEKKQHIQQ
jgi:hypothetical protein